MGKKEEEENKSILYVFRKLMGHTENAPPTKAPHVSHILAVHTSFTQGWPTSTSIAELQRTREKANQTALSLKNFGQVFSERTADQNSVAWDTNCQMQGSNWKILDTGQQQEVPNGILPLPFKSIWGAVFW